MIRKNTIRNSQLKINYDDLRSALDRLHDFKIKGHDYHKTITAMTHEYNITKKLMIKHLPISENVAILSRTESNQQIAKELHISLVDVIYYRLKHSLPNDYAIHKRSMVIFHQINRLGYESFEPIKPISQMNPIQMLRFVKQVLAIIDKNTMYPNDDYNLVSGSAFSVLKDICKMQKQSRSVASILESADIEIYDVLNASGPYTLGYIDDNAYESMHKLAEYIDTFCSVRYDWTNLHEQALNKK